MPSLLKTALLFFLLSCIYSCTKEKKQTRNPTEVSDTLKITIQDSLKNAYTLEPKVMKQVQQLPGYKILEGGLKNLEGEKIGNVKSRSEEWITAAKELRLALLDSVSNRAINARMTLLVTKASILKQEVDKRIVDTATINKESSEFFEAFQNLAIQLNLEYGSSVDDFLKDFRAESQKLIDNARKQKALQNRDNEK
ncbi:MAG: hypothetical protein WA951_10355 [Leeuwenhoekiella sp.]